RQGDLGSPRRRELAELGGRSDRHPGRRGRRALGGRPPEDRRKAGRPPGPRRPAGRPRRGGVCSGAEKHGERRPRPPRARRHGMSDFAGELTIVSAALVSPLATTPAAHAFFASAGATPAAAALDGPMKGTFACPWIPAESPLGARLAVLASQAIAALLAGLPE